MPAQHSVHAIANYFVARALQEKDKEFTPMKLQKLLYYAHGWYLALADEPLFDARVEVWRYGPVIQEIYSQYRKHGGDTITSTQTELRVSESGELEQFEPMVTNDPLIVDFLNQIWEIYSPFTGIQLSNKTHRPGTPWSKIVEAFPQAPSTRERIPNEELKQYFLEVQSGERKD